MKLNRFQTLLDARGPDIDAWPAADGAAARALLAASDDARAALAEAEALDRAMRALPVEGAGPLLRSAILDIPELHDRAPGPAPGGWMSGRRGIAAGWTAIAASAAIGFAVGAWWPAEPPVWQSEDLAVLVYGVPDIDEVLR
jgi:hypothetical protein